MKRLRRGDLASPEAASSLGPSATKYSRPSTAKGGELPSESETESGVKELMSLFPVAAFDGCLPPIILRHQLYSILSDRTQVDRELLALRDRGKVRVFKFGVSEDQYCVVWNEDYRNHVRTVMGGARLCDKLLKVVLPGNQEVSITRGQLREKMKLSEEEITGLVGHGVLLVRGVGRECSWWFAIPGMSRFTKSFTRGRAMVLQMIKRSKYKEILQMELESRKMTVSKLGMMYHIHDIIGADLVERVPTTSGPLLRLVEDTAARR